MRLLLAWSHLLALLAEGVMEKRSPSGIAAYA
jgi:hypothetical protein